MTYAELQARQIVDGWVAERRRLGLSVPTERYEEFVRAITNQEEGQYDVSRLQSPSIR